MKLLCVLGFKLQSPKQPHDCDDVSCSMMHVSRSMRKLQLSTLSHQLLLSGRLVPRQGCHRGSMAQQPSIQSFFATKAQPKRQGDSLDASPKKVTKYLHFFAGPADVHHTLAAHRPRQTQHLQVLYRPQRKPPLHQLMLREVAATCNWQLVTLVVHLFFWSCKLTGYG